MKIEFKVFKMPIAVRLILFTIIEFFGLYCQFNIPWGPFLGTVIIIFGAVLISTKNYSNKPFDIGLEDWKPVSVNEFGRIKTNMQMTKQVKYPFYFKPTFGAVIMFFMFFIAIVFLFAEQFYLFLLLLDIIIMIFPPFLTGMVSLWTPLDLKLKLDRFSTILDEAKNDEKILITPYLRLDKDKKGRQIPEDLRIMIETRRKPSDFVGIQIQVAINNGAHGAVPYMYAVFLCKGKGRSYNALTKMDYGEFITEPGGDEEYGYIVVRQQTGGGGYHTTNTNCIRLYELVTKNLNKLLVLA
jgi:hypothetical protein